MGKLIFALTSNQHVMWINESNRRADRSSNCRNRQEPQSIKSKSTEKGEDPLDFCTHLNQNFLWSNGSYRRENHSSNCTKRKVTIDQIEQRIKKRKKWRRSRRSLPRPASAALLPPATGHSLMNHCPLVQGRLPAPPPSLCLFARGLDLSRHRRRQHRMDAPRRQGRRRRHAWGSGRTAACGERRSGRDWGEEPRGDWGREARLGIGG